MSEVVAGLLGAALGAALLAVGIVLGMKMIKEWEGWH